MTSRKPPQGYEVYPGCTPPDFSRLFLEGKRITLESFCMNERIDPDILPRLVSEVLVEWELTEAEHPTRKDAVSHMINHLRIKAKKEKTAQREQTPGIKSNLRDIDRQTKKRATEYEAQKRNSMSPRDYIRSLGFDPDKVTSVAAAMRMSREHINTDQHDRK